MAWIKKTIDRTSDNADFYAGGVVFAATVATVAALYAIGM
jgi:hypothetical protein